MDWKHGYYADAGYTYGYYPETMPLRLHWASLVQGLVTPKQGFRYLDAGCGQGYGLLIAAAAHPDSEFVGIDFLPEHIAHARKLASAAGLTNVTFIEGDFIELAKSPFALGEFDYAVCHGISTWIAPSVKAGLFSLIGQVLKPGGVFYNGYNTYPGWLGGTPFQHLVLLEQRSKVGAKAIEAARGHMDTLAAHAPSMINTLPALQSRLKDMPNQNPAYLVQEYNNQFWQPVFVSQMMDEMAAVKLDYLGTATLPDASDAFLPQEVRNMLGQQATPQLREQLRDYAVNQTFRRDLYVKGNGSTWRLALRRELNSTRIKSNPLFPRPEAGQPYAIKGGAVELKGQADFYGGLLDLMDQHPEGVTVQALIDWAEEPKKTDVLQAVSLLIHGNWATPIHESSEVVANATVCNSLNKASAAAACDGAPYRYLALPNIAAGYPVGDVEWQILNLIYTHGADFGGQSPDQCADAIAKGLANLGKALTSEGQVVTDPSAARERLKLAITEFMTHKWPHLSRFGA